MINFFRNRTLADYMGICSSDRYQLINNKYRTYQPYKLFGGDDELYDPKYLTWVWTTEPKTEPKKEESNQMYYIPSINKVIFNCPATIILWADGSKTVVKANNEPFDREKGLAMAISKKFFGNKGNYMNHFKKWIG